ncbi:MAG: flagellar export chaperone FliS [Zoogloeaceae bacterium]|jgi:flagellar protein FliS|nr:flagellar export chaperone FliS [Zoogloeaceae bacterium]
MSNMLDETSENTASVSESEINNASPHRLIALLFEGVQNAVSAAKLHAEKGDSVERGAQISKAVNIIANGLKVSLDTQSGGELAKQLAELYDYMISRLLGANMRNDIAALDEVQDLLGRVQTAWQQIDPDRQPEDAP